MFINNLSIVDGLFLGVSAMTGTGLTTVPMSAISRPSFIILWILILIGSPTFMLLPTLIHKRRCFDVLNREIVRRQRNGSLPPLNRLTSNELNIITDFNLLADALYVLTIVILVYLISWLTLGIIFLTIAFSLKPIQPELLQRGFTSFDSAVFTTLAAFSNAGITITSDSLEGIADNPSAYLFISLLIIAGNTALPIFLRLFILFIIKLDTLWGRFINIFTLSTATTAHSEVDSRRRKTRKVLEFIINNPRRLTTHLFSGEETRALSMILLLLIITQYSFFLTTTMNRSIALASQDRVTLAGIGFFQTLSTRSAGFSMMDLRQLNQGLIVIYCVMMYISSTPIIVENRKTKHESARFQSSNSDAFSFMNHWITGIGLSFLRFMSLLSSRDVSPSVLIDGRSTSFESNESNREKFSSIPLLHSDKLDPKEDVPPSISINGQTSRSENKVINRKKLSLTPVNQRFVNESESELLQRLDRAANFEDGKQTEQDDEVTLASIENKLFQHIMRHRSFYVLVAIVICALSEDKKINENMLKINLGYIIFEIISAYGNIGLSLGLPGKTYSLSGGMSIIGKLVLMSLMLLGKHRGQPLEGDEMIDFNFVDYCIACRYYDKNAKERQQRDDRNERYKPFVDHLSAVYENEDESGGEFESQSNVA